MSHPGQPPPTRVRSADLRRLRRGQTVSMFGDEVTGVALPTVALILLHATPFQFGLLAASTYLPYPVIGLTVGAWVDRTRRRRVLMLADAARFAAIASIPGAAAVGGLSLTQLVVVGLVVGTGSVFFNSAYQAFLPSIVRPGEITTANAKLSVSETSAQVGGPPLAGILIGALGAAGAMLVDAASYLVSILTLSSIRRPEPSPDDGGSGPDRRSLTADVVDGLRLVFGDRLLRGLTLTSALSNLGRGMALELFLLFAYNGLGVSPGVAGFMLAAGNVGSLLGSLTCRRLTDRFGIGRILMLSSILKGLPWLLAPLTLLGGALPLIVAIMFASSYFVPVSNVTTLSVRQSLVPRQLQGRVAATTRTVTRTVVPLSAVLGGALAQLGTALFGRQAGLAAVLALGGLLWTSATIMLPRDRLRGVHDLDDLSVATVRDRRPHHDRARPRYMPHEPGTERPWDGDGGRLRYRERRWPQLDDDPDRAAAIRRWPADDTS